MKVLFVNPACLDKRATSEDARVVPIGIYYMAALLLGKGFDARILNLASLDDDKDTIQTFKAMIEKEKPDLIGFSVTNPSRINAVACARAARKLLPRAWI
ncbi:MAG: cobalamin B12-binding domain-containing protein, partial [Desulfobacteraceae bacterium]|nr:cobalamin B12-binding domain-containing protein [Desulfobacteraceae bacterium]